MAKIITFGNFKGGTGKTTNACMIGYQLSKMGYKVLLADLDPQANATQLYMNTLKSQTQKVTSFKTTLMSAISNDDLKSVIINIKDGLDLLPSFADFTSYPIYLEEKYPDSQVDRANDFKRKIKPFEEDYDYIVIDTPPTVSMFTDNALMASDYVVIVMQTQERSYTGCVAFLNYLQELVRNYHADYDVVGVLPVLLKSRSQVDDLILSQATEAFGKDNIFETIVKNMERLKRYDITGITDPDCKTQKHDMHDMKTNRLYKTITAELLERMNEIEEA
jgi:chromosome partitioning protein